MIKANLCNRLSYNNNYHVCSTCIAKVFKVIQPHINAPTDITNLSKSAAYVYSF